MIVSLALLRSQAAAEEAVARAHAQAAKVPCARACGGNQRATEVLRRGARRANYCLQLAPPTEVLLVVACLLNMASSSSPSRVHFCSGPQETCFCLGSLFAANCQNGTSPICFAAFFLLVHVL